MKMQCSVLLLVVLALVTNLGLATSSPSSGPTTLRPTISPSGPTPSPTLASLNFADKNAFLQMSANLNRGSWVDCHFDVDACNVCSENTPDHGVDCEEVPIPGQAGRFERRIVGLRFRNLNIKGTVDQFALTSFTALKVVDLSNNRSKPYANRIMPEFGEECVRLSFCYEEDKSCDFGLIAPLCSTNVTANASAPPGDSVGMYIGIAFGVLGFIVLGTVGFLYYSQKQGKKRNRQDQKARNRKRKKMMEQPEDDVQTVFSQQSAYSNASSTGSVRTKPAERKAKSFSSIRTRQKKAEAAAAQQEWVQQVDPATGGPYWVHMNTGAIRYDPPGLERKASSKSLKKVGSMKKTGSSKKLVRKGSSKGGGLKPKSSTMEMAIPGMTGPPLMGPPQPMMGGPPGLVPPGMAPSGPWEQTFDSTTNSTYWVNSATGQFSWTQPTM